MTNHRISTVDELRAVIGVPTTVVQSKIADRLIPLTRRWIELSPFLCIATSAPGGDCDVSPRGDPAGFVRILDDHTLLIPDRPGNRIADTLTNILVNPHVGLLFLIPGVGDTFRVNGRAWITTDPDVLAPSMVDGKLPRLGIVVEINQAYTQCSKAFIRSSLWDASRHVDPAELPTIGSIIACLNDTVDAAQWDAERGERYARREGFY